MLAITFIGITLLSLLLFYYATGSDKRVLYTCSAWLLFIGPIAFTGFFTNTQSTPPRFMLVMLGATILSVYLYKRTRKLKVNKQLLLAIHILRLPVELVLYELFLQKQIPVLMTFKGWNMDIFMGITALLLFIYTLVRKKEIPTKLFITWNYLGICLVTTIFMIGFFSAPFPFQQLAFDQPNRAIALFPFVYLPALVVPLVYVSHVIVLREINRERH